MRRFFLCIGLAICTGTIAQNIGIGKLIPLYKLHVDSGHIKLGESVWSSAVNDRYLKFGDADYVQIGEAGMDDAMELYARHFLFKPSGAYPGRVGIGISTAPTAMLEVNGTLKITDGTQASGLVLTSDASGNASWQNPPNANTGFHVRRVGSAILLPSNTETTVIFDAETFDDGSDYNTATGEYTCPASGVYQFNIKLQWNLSPTGGFSPRVYTYLVVNGVRVEEASDYTTFTGSANIVSSFSTTRKLVAGDVIKVTAEQTSPGGNQYVGTIGTSFSGYRVY